MSISSPSRSGPDLDEVLTSRPPIGLDELVTRAALLTRIDRKYVVPAAQLPDLLSRTPASTRVLEIEGETRFGYHSTYLDTPDLIGFHQAGRSQRRRFKVRTRHYRETGACWLEVKTKGARGTTVKERVPHPGGVDAFLAGESRDFVSGRLAAAGIDPALAGLIRPVLTTSYRRSTLFLPETASRVTIDLDLRWTSLLDSARRKLERPALAIVETKSGPTPSAVDRVLWEHGHRPRRLSKYGVGMAALNPWLPHMKWHRSLERDLGLSRP